jgi:hypothetical protein
VNGYYLGYNVNHANLKITVSKIQDLMYPDLSFGIIPHTYISVSKKVPFLGFAREQGRGRRKVGPGNF